MQIALTSELEFDLAISSMNCTYIKLIVSFVSFILQISEFLLCIYEFYNSNCVDITLKMHSSAKYSVCVTEL